MQTEQGQRTAAQIAEALKALGELDKVSAIDADTCWRQLVAHIRSARPHVMLELKDVP